MENNKATNADLTSGIIVRQVNDINELFGRETSELYSNFVGSSTSLVELHAQLCLLCTMVNSAYPRCGNFTSILDTLSELALNGNHTAYHRMCKWDVFTKFRGVSIKDILSEHYKGK